MGCPILPQPAVRRADDRRDDWRPLKRDQTALEGVRLAETGERQGSVCELFEAASLIQLSPAARGGVALPLSSLSPIEGEEIAAGQTSH